jgi:hypothetical protein
MLNNHLTGIHINGPVIGLTIIGNEVYFGGIIEKSNYVIPDLWQPGTCIFWATMDNGEGGSLLDLISLAYNGHPITNTPFTRQDVLGFCENPSSFPWNPIVYFIVEEGNIQINY